MSNPSDVAARFTELFEGNHAAIGLEEGGCMHLHSEPETKAWDECIRDHLNGDMPIGVYPMVPGVVQQHTSGYVQRLPWAVMWGCVDFDEGEEESWVHAKNVWLALQTFSITGWIERSRSKGYHVWIFADEWISAPLMRRALLAACQLVEAPTKEVNPKQDALAEGQLGNYVRLPYPGALGPGSFAPPKQLDPERRVVVTPSDHGVARYGVESFVLRACSARTSSQPLHALAAHYQRSEAPIKRRDWATSALRGDAIDRLKGKAKVIFQQGPLEGSGRGHTLYKLARYLKEDGRHTVEEAVELIRDADSRWGKFYARPDGDQRIMELVQRAWFNPS